jgi:hypothetical protein
MESPRQFQDRVVRGAGRRLGWVFSPIQNDLTFYFMHPERVAVRLARPLAGTREHDLCGDATSPSPRPCGLGGRVLRQRVQSGRRLDILIITSQFVRADGRRMATPLYRSSPHQDVVRAPSQSNDNLSSYGPPCWMGSTIRNDRTSCSMQAPPASCPACKTARRKLASMPSTSI